MFVTAATDIKPTATQIPFRRLLATSSQSNILERNSSMPLLQKIIASII